MLKILTIAGSDCSGGAGIQADLKTIAAHKAYGMSVITALTAQNTTGVRGICNTPPQFVREQLECVFEDIFPDAVKIGMVSSGEIITEIIRAIKKYRPLNVVVDPVMISTSGSKLLDAHAADVLKRGLLPLANLITPNIHEAEELSDIKIANRNDMERAAAVIADRGLNSVILIKGGHLSDTPADLLYDSGKIIWYDGERIDNVNTHGTGCTLSSAIACNLAEGFKTERSIELARKYVRGAIKAGLNLGAGAGPLNHTFCIKTLIKD